VVALLALTVLTACGAPAHRQVAAAVGPPRGSVVRLLFVGGSLTFGLFASAAPDTYPSLVAAALRQSGLRLSTATLASSGATAASVVGWQLDIPSDIVVVQLGANDHELGVPLVDFRAAYGTTLRRLRSASPHALMVCLGIWQRRAQTNSSGDTGAAYDDLIRRLCVAERGTYVDLTRLFLDPSNHGPEGQSTFMGISDWYHPNDRGHTRLARAVLAVIVPRSGPSGSHAGHVGVR
jgi:lysophospholipase L1-like esterase